MKQSAWGAGGKKKTDGVRVLHRSEEKKMTVEPFREAILALREGHWDQYEPLIRPLLKSNSDETWARLATEHPATVNLLSVLSLLSKKQARAACHWLLPAIGKLSALSLGEAFSLLDFAETLDASYWAVPAQQLTPHIVERTDLGAEICEGLRADPRRGDTSQRVWAVAFSSAAPQIAARHLVGLMTGSRTDTQLLIHLLHALPGDVPVVQAELAACDKPLADFLLRQTDGSGPLSNRVSTQRRRLICVRNAHLKKKTRR